MSYDVPSLRIKTNHYYTSKKKKEIETEVVNDDLEMPLRAVNVHHFLVFFLTFLFFDYDYDY